MLTFYIPSLSANFIFFIILSLCNLSSLPFSFTLRRSSEKRLMRNLSRKLSSKLLSLLDPEEQHNSGDAIHPESSEDLQIHTSSASSTQSLPDLSKSEGGGML